MVNFFICSNNLHEILCISCHIDTFYSLVVLLVKNPPGNAGDVRDTSSIPGPGRSPGGGHGNLLQYPWLEIPHGQRGLEDRAMVQRVAKSQTWLKQLSMHTQGPWHSLYSHCLANITTIHLQNFFFFPNWNCSH